MGEQEKKKGMSTLGKLGIGCGGFIVLIIIIAVVAGSGSKSSNTQKVTNPDSNTTNTSTTKSESAKEKLTISNSVAKDKGYGMWEVVGEVKNNDISKHSATLKATFYGDSGQILGTASGAVNEISASETKTFNLISTDDVAGYKDMKVQVDTLF